MPSIVLQTADGKRVVTSKSDQKLYETICNPPNTWTQYTRGTDLYAHIARSGKVYFYTYSWSMWQGEEERYSLITKAEAEQFMLEKMSIAGIQKVTEEELSACKEFGLDLETETA